MGIQRGTQLLQPGWGRGGVGVDEGCGSGCCCGHVSGRKCGRGCIGGGGGHTSPHECKKVRDC
eukprot:1159912-Pelagomonas_calceolata.AAC.1